MSRMPSTNFTHGQASRGIFGRERREFAASTGTNSRSSNSFSGHSCHEENAQDGQGAVPAVQGLPRAATRSLKSPPDVLDRRASGQGCHPLDIAKRRLPAAKNGMCGQYIFAFPLARQERERRQKTGAASALIHLWCVYFPTEFRETAATNISQLNIRHRYEKTEHSKRREGTRRQPMPTK